MFTFISQDRLVQIIARVLLVDCGRWLVVSGWWLLVSPEAS